MSDSKNQNLAWGGALPPQASKFSALRALARRLASLGLIWLGLVHSGWLPADGNSLRPQIRVAPNSGSDVPDPESPETGEVMIARRESAPASRPDAPA